MNYRIYLYTGSLLFAVFLLLCYWLPVEDNIRLPAIEAFKVFPLWLVFIMAVIVAPLTEEYAFRSWQKKENRKRWVVPVFFLFFVVFSTGNYWLGGFALLFLILYWIWFPKISTWHIVFVTTVIFALLHLPEEDYATRDFYILLTGYIGLALIFTWLRLRYYLWMAILGHALWNFTVLFLLNAGDFPLKSTTYDLSTTRDTIRITQLSALTWEPSISTSSGQRPGQVSISRGTKEDLLRPAFPASDDVLFVFRTTPFAFYSLEIRPVATAREKGSPTAATQLITMLQVSLDTTYARKDGYLLEYDGSGKRHNHSPETGLSPTIGEVTYYGSLKGLAAHFQKRYNLPFNAADTSYAVFVYDNQLSLETQRKKLKERYGIDFIKTSREMMIITVREH